MDFNAGNARKLLEQFDFAKLFIEELGWDRHSADLSVPISGATYTLRAVAEKRGMVLRMSLLVNAVAASMAPVRKPLPSGL